jgi:hypothetical protein
VLSLPDGGIFKSLILSTSTILKDELSETQCNSIVTTIEECGRMLARWAEVTEEMYPDFQHDIPDKSEMSISKLAKGGLLTSDTCNTARKIRLLLCEKIEEAAREKGLPEDEINVLEGDCWNHLRNVWLGGMIKCLNKYLNTALQDELEAIDSRLRVSTSMDSVLRAVEKEFSHCANYAKGHGDQFYHWMGHNHPGAQLWPVEKASGS